MTQVSSNTIAFDQIFFRVKEFVQKDIQNSFLSKNDRIEEYNRLLFEIQETIARPSTKYIPFIKGEPPFSEKVNNFSSKLAEDLNSIARQLDYINAKTVNSYNLFSKEVENEKRYSERIASKVKILQMYSRSPSNDIIYSGDSFDNYDQIDVGRIRAKFNPLISDGVMTLPIGSKRKWNVSKLSVLPSNGFLGNNHQVVKASTPEGDTYEYVFMKNTGISRIGPIIDSNPLTYFEYDAISLSQYKDSLGSVNLISENEFCYISDGKLATNVPQGQLINWSNHNISSDPLKLIVSMDGSNKDAMSNSVEVIPYFGSCDYVKITEVQVTDSSGTKEQILKEPIYIGSNMLPLNMDSSKNYFYNKATIRYPERKTANVRITIEQPDSKNVQIKHLYWKPNYPANTLSNSPFVGLNRFNPDALNRDIYEEVQYDVTKLIPSISNPNQFKKTGLGSISSFKIQVKKKAITYNKWAISFNINGTASYFYGFSDDVDIDEIDYVVTEQLPNSPAYSYDVTILNVNSKIISGENVALVIGGETVSIDDVIKVTNQTQTNSNGLYKVVKVGSASEPWQLDRILYIDWTNDLIFGELDKNPKYFDSEESGQVYLDAVTAYINSLENNSMTVLQTGGQVQITNPKIAYYTRQVAARNESINVPLIAQYEVYPAQRMAIGLRDITVSHEKYANQAEVISTPFLYDTPIEALMLSVESDIDNTFLDKINFNYYVSLEDGPWFRISPLELDNRGIAEVFAFNQNIPEDFKLPGVAYLNYPEVPLNIKKAAVRIEMLKDKNTNITPSVYSYQLIAKVKR
jgi:hypothetical protein